MTVQRVESEKPLYIQVNPKDNMAIVANAGGLPEGTVFPCGLNLLQNVPQGHKVALADLNPDEAIIRYGEIIGYAMRGIARGAGSMNHW